LVLLSIPDAADVAAAVAAGGASVVAADIVAGVATMQACSVEE